MSDDNKAAPHIRTLTNVEVINYCDLLYISFRINNQDVKVLNEYYKAYINLYEKERIPYILRNKDGTVRTFPQIMAYCYDKFNKSEKLLEYIKLIIKNI
jgi:hypothetical protein